MITIFLSSSLGSRLISQICFDLSTVLLQAEYLCARLSVTSWENMPFRNPQPLFALG